MEESSVWKKVEYCVIFFKSVVKSICNIFYHNFLWVKTCSNTLWPLKNHDSGLSNLKQLISFLFSLNERNTRQRLLPWVVTLQLLFCFAAFQTRSVFCNICHVTREQKFTSGTGTDSHYLFLELAQILYYKNVSLAFNPLKTLSIYGSHKQSVEGTFCRLTRISEIHVNFREINCHYFRTDFSINFLSLYT